MRALCLTATGSTPHLDVIDVAPPVLRGPTEVRIGIHAAALNHLDLWVANGAPGLKVPPLPHIVGSDGAGTVLEVGSAVDHVRPGDRVVINPGVSCGACDCCTCRRGGLLPPVRRAGRAPAWNRRRGAGAPGAQRRRHPRRMVVGGSGGVPAFDPHCLAHADDPRRPGRWRAGADLGDRRRGCGGCASDCPTARRARRRDVIFGRQARSRAPPGRGIRGQPPHVA